MGQQGTKKVYYDGSEYCGEFNQSGEEHGKGKINYANGDVLEGHFQNGSCVEAHIRYSNSNTYNGHMLQNQFHGWGVFRCEESIQKGLFRYGKFIYGEIIFSDGAVYRGSLEDNERSGKGLLQDQNSVYKGYFKHNQFHGTGTLTHRGYSEYQGGFCNGQMSGHGHLVKYEHGRKILEYVGEFKQGTFHKEGMMIYENKDKYEGSFLEGKRHGYGVYTYINEDVYSGQWYNDSKNDDEATIKFKSGNIYKGGVKEGKYHGKGKLMKPTLQEYYQGEYLNNMMHGKGVLKKSGEFYIGEFAEDKKQGKAKIVYDDGSILHCSFTNGEIHGKAIKHGNGKENAEFYRQISYDHGMKHGPYKIENPKDQYSEKGQYKNGAKDGQILIQKEGFKAKLIYQNGAIIEEEEEKSGLIQGSRDLMEEDMILREE